MNANEPAFPGNYYVKDASGLNCTHFPGMTKRELFAAMALQGILSANAKCSTEVNDVNVDQVVAREAVASADALIAELSKEPSE